MSRVMGNIESNNVFSCKCIFSLTMGCARCIGHMMLMVLGNILCDLDLGVKVK